MIHQLRLFFSSDKTKAAFETDSVFRNQVKNVLQDHFIARKVLNILTGFWLMWILEEYRIVMLRPASIYIADNYFVRLFMPTLPCALQVYSVIAIGFCTVAYNFYFSPLRISKVILTATVMWLNILPWGYGFFSHVGHVFVLSHLLGIFLPDVNVSKENAAHSYLSMQWYYLGIVANYSMSGIWKLGGLIYKLFANDGTIHWLHPKAALYNSIVGFHKYDIPLTSQFDIFHFSWPWQVGFLIILLLQTFAVFIVLFPKRYFLFCIAIVTMHFVNITAFAIMFIWQPLVIFILFFPYHKIFNPTLSIENK